MKLAAIYNVWDGVELLRGSMDSVADGVDVFIIVYQDVSNYGEEFKPLENIDLSDYNCVFVKYKPTGTGAGYHERQKRNIGLTMARDQRCTHFLHMDCDEYYSDFLDAKKMYQNTGHDGTVCKLFTYFKKPTLRFENTDNYFVPFIHRLKGNSAAGVNEYPFYVDPTRRINTDDVVEIDAVMHHFSYVRDDIERKVRNSTAVNNIKKSNLLRDYYDESIGTGSYVEDYKQKLIQVDDQFGINHFLRPNTIST